jgi:hypothetical protein
VLAHQPSLDDFDCSLLMCLFVDAAKDLPVGAFSYLFEQFILFGYGPFLNFNQLMDINFVSLN